MHPHVAVHITAQDPVRVVADCDLELRVLDQALAQVKRHGRSAVAGVCLGCQRAHPCSDAAQALATLDEFHVRWAR